MEVKEFRLDLFQSMVFSVHLLLDELDICYWWRRGKYQTFDGPAIGGHAASGPGFHWALATQNAL
jgi:hypothetical protein